MTLDQIGSMSRNEAFQALVTLEKQQDDLARQRWMLISRLADGDSQAIKETQQTETLITVEEASRVMGCSQHYLKRNKGLPFLRKIHGKKTLVSQQALTQWLLERRQ